MLRYLTIFYWILAFVFLVGGAMQFLGILSNTISTMAIGLVIIAMLVGNKVKVPANHLPVFYLIILTLTSAVVNSVSPVLTIMYMFSFILVPFFVYRFIAARVINRINRRKLFRFFILVGLIQLPVLLFQHTFALQLTHMAAKTLSVVDVGFGTFFFKNDHGLCFFLLCMIIYLLYDTELYVSKVQKTLLIIYYSVTIALSNSYISFLLLIMVFGFYFLGRLNVKRMILSALVLLLLYGAVTTLSFLQEIVGDKYEHLERKAINKEDEFDAEKRDLSEAERGDIVMFYLAQDVSVIGNGPYNYFDPVKGEFRTFANFSQYIWFYNDLGILGVIGVIIYYVSLYLANYKLKNYRIIFLLLIVIYSFFTNTLSDLAFNIVFAFFILKDSPYLISNLKEYEYSMYTIPRLEEN